MAINLTLPAFGERNGVSAKDVIVSVLAKEWPLSVKEIFGRVSRLKQESISYQAVHKSVVALEADGILVKNGKGFELNRNWIDNLKKFALNLDEAYSGELQQSLLKREDFDNLSLKFDNTSALSITLAEIFAIGKLFGKEPKIGIGYLRHVLWPLRFDFRDFDTFRKMTTAFVDSYAIVQGNTPLDKWLEKTWKTGGFKHVDVGVDLGNPKQDLLAVGEFVIEIRYSDETIEAIDKVYERKANLTDLFKEYFSQALLKQNFDIKTAFTRNPETARLLRHQIMGHFNNGK